MKVLEREGAKRATLGEDSGRRKALRVPVGEDYRRESSEGACR